MPTYKPVTQTLTQIRNTAEQLAKIATKLASEADSAEAAGFTDLTVTNFDQIDRAMDYAAKYVAAVEASIRHAQRKRGDFGGATVSGAPARTDKKAARKGHRSGHPTTDKDTENTP